MELKHYGRILWKRAWLPALLLLVVGAVSLLTSNPPPSTYSTTMRFTIGVKPQEIPDQYHYDSYYAWLSSEYLADDMTEIVRSQAFAADVNRRLAEAGSAGFGNHKAVESGLNVARMVSKYFATHRAL